MAVPILWQDPFSSDRRPLFIPKYFSSLGEDEKFILKEDLEKHGINEDFSNTIFDYAKFLKVLDLWNLDNKVGRWIAFKLSLAKVNHIINLLIKLFIESGATLHKLDLNFPVWIELKPVIFYVLEENKQFFSRIQHLCLGKKISDNHIGSAATLLKALAKSTTKISTIELQWFESICKPQLLHALINVIKSQEQLRLFFLDGDYGGYPTEFYGIISALESQKNSLQEVILDHCDFSAEFEVLNKCKNLETLRIRNCTTRLLKLLDYKVSTLYVVDFQNYAMPLIFEKSGKLLQRLILELNGEFGKFRDE
ncbi:hypothetical protein C2G38_2045513 [Gigaspora rosea]|uniref:F-box domain-containing protein n=1 Tax=Gigaspora rosea TaxID=44941 RepID=A0A397UG18_9GLOM|nr:hypothetical protein C2G38_2045513 [Gigaspora rosea]